MELTPSQIQKKQALEQGVTHDLSHPGVENVQVHIQDDNTWLSFENIDGKHHYQMKGFADKVVGAVKVEFNYRIRRHSNGEVLKKDTFLYQETSYWPFALASPPQGIIAFGYEQAINGLLRRLPEFGGNPEQFGPSLFTFTGETITLIAFEVATTPESVEVIGQGTENELSEPQGDGEISINVTHGDAPFEYSLDTQNWQDENTFTGLSAQEYKVFVRAKEKVSMGAPMRYRTVTVGSVETVVDNA